MSDTPNAMRNEGVFFRVPPSARGSLQELAKLLREDAGVVDSLNSFVSGHKGREAPSLLERLEGLEATVEALMSKPDAGERSDVEQKVSDLSAIARRVYDAAAAFNAAVDDARAAGIMVSGKVRSILLAEVDEHRFSMKNPLSVSCLVGVGRVTTNEMTDHISAGAKDAADALNKAGAGEDRVNDGWASNETYERNYPVPPSSR